MKYNLIRILLVFFMFMGSYAICHNETHAENYKINLLKKKIHLGDDRPYFSKRFQISSVNVNKAYIEMDVVGVVLPDEKGLPFHPPDKGYYYNYVYINDYKVDYINRYLKPIKPSASRQSSVWQTVKIEIPVSRLKSGSNTFRFEMGRHKNNYEDLKVKNININIGRDSSSYKKIYLLKKQLHLGDSRPRFSKKFPVSSPNIRKAYIEMELIDVVLPDKKGRPFHPPDKGYYYNYLYINGHKIDYVNKYLKSIKPTSSRQSGAWQTVKIPIPVSRLKTGTNTFRFEMGKHKNNYEDLEVRNISIFIKY